MESLKQNLFYYISIAAMLIVALAAIIFSYNILSHFSEKGENAIKIGQRVMIDVETMEVTLTPAIKKSAKAIKKTEEADAGPKEIVYDGRLAVLIKDIGMMRDNTAMAMALPVEYGISISPYSYKFDELLEKSKAEKRDVLLNFPMAAIDFPESDPGNLGMMFSVESQQNIDRFKKLVEKHAGVIGLIAPEKEGFTHVPEQLSAIMEELKKSTLTFIYNSQPENDYLQNGLKTNNVPFYSRPVYIDSVLAPEVIAQELAKVSKRLEVGEEGILVVIQPFPISIKMVQNWVKKLGKDGVYLSPVSMVLSEEVKKNIKQEGDKNNNG